MALAPEILELIAEEERALAEVMDSLRAQIVASGERLGIESARAREFTAAIVASSRDVDKQMLASDEAVAHGLTKMKRADLANLGQLMERPYFARIILEEVNPRGAPRKIEYKIGIRANVDCRIIDWKKAPISRLYYELKEGDEYAEIIQGREREGKILVRHRVEIEDGVLKKVSCRFGDFELRDGQWQQAGSGAAARSGAGGLPDVLSLITAEQFRAITEDADSAVLIQGVAGSGKTTVALYRLAWLLEREGADLPSEDVQIVVRSGALRSYIETSLPMLGITGVRVITLAEFITPVLRQIAHDELRLDRMPTSADSFLAISRLKRSMAMLRALEDYVEDQRQRLIVFLNREIPWGQFSSRLREQFNRITAKVGGEEKGQTLSNILPQFSKLLGEHSLQLAPEISERLNSVQTRLELYREDLMRILARPEAILKYDESRLLDAEIVSRAREETERNFQEGKVSLYDEVLLARLYQLKNGYIPRLLASGEATTTRIFRHLVVDEVQDFSPPELAVLIGAVGKPSELTIVGDTAQQISQERTFPGWDKLRTYWNLGSELSRFVTLSISHRSTLPIMRLADHILGEGRTSSGREGKPPIWFRCHKEGRGVQEALQWLERVTEKFPDSLTAVICRSVQEAQHVVSLLDPTFGGAARLGDDYSFSFDAGIVVSAVEQVKGLEFLNVLLWNPSERSYEDSELGRNLLYVAVTRAQEHLAIATWNRPAAALPPKSARLCRIITDEPPDERP